MDYHKPANIIVAFAGFHHKAVQNNARTVINFLGVYYSPTKNYDYRSELINRSSSSMNTINNITNTCEFTFNFRLGLDEF